MNEETQQTPEERRVGEAIVDYENFAELEWDWMQFWNRIRYMFGGWKDRP
jgi:hypothetical protein